MKDRKWLYSTYQEYCYWSRKMETYYNLPWLRSPSNHRFTLRLKDLTDDLRKDGYNLKHITKEEIRRLNSWEDIHVSAFSERRSWKRNSKRRHQWKTRGCSSVG